jgi:hypothetical protein
MLDVKHLKGERGGAWLRVAGRRVRVGYVTEV